LPKRLFDNDNNIDRFDACNKEKLPRISGPQFIVPTDHSQTNSHAHEPSDLKRSTVLASLKPRAEDKDHPDHGK